MANAHANHAFNPLDHIKRLKNLSTELGVINAMYVWQDKWIDLCLRAGPTDRTAFEAAAEKCYRAAGEPWHGRVVWLPSPAADAVPPSDGGNPDTGSWYHEKLDLFTTAAEQVPPLVEQHLEARDWCSINRYWNMAQGQWIIERTVETELIDAIRAASTTDLHRAIPLWQQLSSSLDASHRSAALIEADRVTSAQTTAQWPATLPSVAFARIVLGITPPGAAGECLQAFETASKEVLWWYPTRHCVLAWERPTAIHLERTATQEIRLHANHGPAAVWSDGWAIYAIHGVAIPLEQRHIVEQPSAITVAEIEAERNAEVRRVMIDRYGLARYVADSGAQIVEALPDDHPITGLHSARLLRKDDLWEDEPIIYADLLNSTPEPDGSVKRYMLRVDPNAYGGEASRNVHAAAASTWRHADGSLVYADWRDYRPWAES